MSIEIENIKNFVIHRLEGYSGIHLKQNKPLIFNPGINLLVGRNGSGKTNLIRLIQHIATRKGEISRGIETLFFEKHANRVLSKKGKHGIRDKFGDVTVAKYSFTGQVGEIVLRLKDTTNEIVLRNVIKDVTTVQSVIELECKSIPLKFKQIVGHVNVPKFESSGYVSVNPISREYQNPVHAMMEGPVNDMISFIKTRMQDFFKSEEFVHKMNDFEAAVNRKFIRFFGTTSKHIKIDYNEIASSGRVSLILMDRGNYIQSHDISSGEAILLSLIFSLAAVRSEQYDILAFDEPDTHMHDDMVQVFVEELKEISTIYPNSIILVASHSTALIERLAALGREQVNVISFDNDRRVRNSENDIEFINALTRNGVKFSPLMLSKRQNIFIENQLKSGKEQRDFLLKFFPVSSQPNVIPIGTSGNVNDSESFKSIFEEILNVSRLAAVGIQDGDMWFKHGLKDYMADVLPLSKLISMLAKEKGIYIMPSDRKVKSNSFYFNFWEIENLFLIDEMLGCWKSKSGERLTENKYHEWLKSRTEVIAKEYLKTFYKSISRLRVEDGRSVKRMLSDWTEDFELIKESLDDKRKVEEKMNTLVAKIIDKRLFHWVPGKEIKRLLEREYTFDDSDFNFMHSRTSKHLRKISDRM